MEDEAVASDFSPDASADLDGLFFKEEEGDEDLKAFLFLTPPPSPPLPSEQEEEKEKKRKRLDKTPRGAPLRPTRRLDAAFCTFINAHLETSWRKVFQDLLAAEGVVRGTKRALFHLEEYVQILAAQSTLDMAWTGPNLFCQVKEHVKRLVQLEEQKRIKAEEQILLIQRRLKEEVRLLQTRTSYCIAVVYDYGLKRKYKMLHLGAQTQVRLMQGPASSLLRFGVYRPTPAQAIPPGIDLLSEALTRMLDETGSDVRSVLTRLHQFALYAGSRFNQLERHAAFKTPKAKSPKKDKRVSIHTI